MTGTPTASRCVMTQIVMPTHTNGAAGVMFGGVMMQWIDVCAGVAAMRHAAGRVLTASIDRLDFVHPVHVGDVVVLHAQVNYAGRTSMEVGCRVETEDMATGSRRKSAGPSSRRGRWTPPVTRARSRRWCSSPTTIAAATPTRWRAAPSACAPRAASRSVCRGAACLLRCRHAGRLLVVGPPRRHRR